ncbi:oxidoreductase [alpha proteobacterium U9-1i]|nr:oxidoreductase [alpha proteobacterium U9-1i]
MNKRLRVGILGAAHINKVAILDAAAGAPGFVPTAIASRSLDKAQAYAAEHGIAHAFGDYHAAIASHDVDAIYIPLPNSQHVEWSIAALEAGKPVLCEKPLAMNADEARTLRDTVDRTGGVFVEAFHYRYHTFIRRIKQLIDAGAIGDLKSLSIIGHVPGARMKADNIRRNAALGGGVTMDLGVYAIDAMRYLVGETPRVVSAKAELSLPEIDGAMHAELAFPNGVTADFHVSHISPHPETESAISIVGSEGAIHATRPYLPHNSGELRLQTAKMELLEHADAMTTYMFQARAFIEHAARERIVETDVHSGIINMEIIDAVYRAAGLRPRGV